MGAAHAKRDNIAATSSRFPEAGSIASVAVIVAGNSREVGIEATG